MASGHVEAVAGGGGGGSLTNVRMAGAKAFRTSASTAQGLALSDPFPAATRWVVLLTLRRAATALPTVTMNYIPRTALTDAGPAAAFVMPWPSGGGAISVQWTDGASEGGLAAWALDADGALVVDDLSRANPATVTNETGSAAFAVTINTSSSMVSPDVPVTSLNMGGGWRFHYGHTTAPGSLTFPTGPGTYGALVSIGAA